MLRVKTRSETDPSMTERVTNRSVTIFLISTFQKLKKIIYSLDNVRRPVTYIVLFKLEKYYKNYKKILIFLKSNKYINNMNYVF